MRLCSCVTILSRLSWEIPSKSEGTVPPHKCLQEQHRSRSHPFSHDRVDLSRVFLHLFHTDSLFAGSYPFPYYRTFPHWSHKVDHSILVFCLQFDHPLSSAASPSGKVKNRRGPAVTCILQDLVHVHFMFLGNFSGRCSWAQQWYDSACVCVCVCKSPR